MTSPPDDMPDTVQWTGWTGEVSPSAITVVRYLIEPTDQPVLLALLLPDERLRANRFRQSADRQRFVAGRGWLRWLAARLTGTYPEQVQLAVGPFGKPELLNPASGLVNWHVNVSHSGEWLLLAVGPVPVGVDLEWVSPDWPYEDLLPSSFNADDQAKLAVSTEPRRLFYTYWTRKESLLKSTGQGLTDDLTAISSSKGWYQTALIAATGMQTWQATSFRVAADYVGAVACPTPVAPIHFFTIDLTTANLAIQRPDRHTDC